MFFRAGTNMSLMKFNRIVISGVLPFNFGMHYEDWVSLYQTIPELCGSDPKDWTQERIDIVNHKADEENALYEKLMTLPDAEFYKEVDRLAELLEENNGTDE